MILKRWLLVGAAGSLLAVGIPIQQVAATVLTLAVGTQIAQVDAAEAAKIDAQCKAIIAKHPEILKIPYVERMTYGADDNWDPYLIVQVDKEENVSSVERSVPSELDGITVIVELARSSR